MRWLLAVLVFACASAARAEPRRIVSLDYCSDQFVLALADREQIAALSRGAQRDDSYFRDRARGIRQTRGSLEEVLALRPDLIVRNYGGPWDAEAVYGRFHVPVLHVGDTPTFAEARADMLEAAGVMGHRERGEALARDLDRRLAHLAAIAPRERPPMIYLSAGGAVAGRGTMMDSVITAAGARNIWSGESWTVLPLEQLIDTPPTLIALGFFDHRRTQMNMWAPGHNAVFRRALARSRTVSLPLPAISCQAWYAVDAAERISAALQ